MEVILGITNECGITCCGILKKKLRHELIDALGKKKTRKPIFLTFLKRWKLKIKEDGKEELKYPN